MTKALLISDNHNQTDLVYTILKNHPGLDYYIHCGDSLLTAAELNKMFNVAVAGNNDFNHLKKTVVITVEKWKILVCHGDLFFQNIINPVPELQIALKKFNCNAVFYGHSHIANDVTLNNQRYICPGSLSNPRSQIGPSYMLLTITADQIQTELIKI